jgi:hypothetical protein
VATAASSSAVDTISPLTVAATFSAAELGAADINMTRSARQGLISMIASSQRPETNRCV